jgi:ArsR family metal-binding transcriptional regulator
VQDFMKFIQDHPELFEFMNEIKERIEEAIDDTHDE